MLIFSGSIKPLFIIILPANTDFRVKWWNEKAEDILPWDGGKCWPELQDSNTDLHEADKLECSGSLSIAHGVSVGGWVVSGGVAGEDGPCITPGLGSLVSHLLHKRMFVEKKLERGKREKGRKRWNWVWRCVWKVRLFFCSFTSMERSAQCYIVRATECIWKHSLKRRSLQWAC